MNDIQKRGLQPDSPVVVYHTGTFLAEEGYVVDEIHIKLINGWTILVTNQVEVYPIDISPSPWSLVDATD